MKLNSFIICDDIRSELGNKYSLMGIYLDRIVFQRPKGTPEAWPKAIKLGFYARFTKEEKDNTIPSGSKFNFYYKKDDNLVLLGSGVISDPKTLLSQGQFAITIIHNPLVIEGQGVISFYMDFLDDKGIIIQPSFLLGQINIIEREE